MFPTPRNESARRQATSRRLPFGHQTSAASARDSGGESPVPGTVPDDSNRAQENGDNEMLCILRSLQQQVSALQAQQARSTATGSPAAASSSNPSPVERRKLPKDLTVSTIIIQWNLMY